MKNFLLKLLSIKYNISSTSNKTSDRQNENPDLILPISTEQNIPLEQSYVQGTYHSSRSYCHKQPSGLIRQKISNHSKTLVPPLDQLKSSQTTTVDTKNISNNSISPTKTKQKSAVLAIDKESDTKKRNNEMNIRELVNTVRTEIGALIDADRSNSKEKSTSTNLVNNNFSKNSSARKKKKKSKKTKGKSRKASKSNKSRSRSRQLRLRKSRSRNKPLRLRKSRSGSKSLRVRKSRRQSSKPRRSRSKSSRSRRGRSKSSKLRRSKSKSSRSRGSKSKSSKPRRSRSKSSRSRRSKSKSSRSRRTRSKSSKSSKHRSRKTKSNKKEQNQSKPRDPDKSSENLSRKPSDEVNPPEQCNNCCCNFIHHSLRQVIHDAEQMKQFALNTAKIGMNSLNLKDPNSPAICIPMYNCEDISNEQFSQGPTFTTISNDKHDSMIIQSIDTNRGKIQIKLDPQSFGLAPFFSEQYETFIKGPPDSIFLNNYINTFNK